MATNMRARRILWILLASLAAAVVVAGLGVAVNHLRSAQS